MRRLVGTLIALLLLALPATASAEAASFDGLMEFPEIHGPADPEGYSWRVHLGPEQELRQIDEHEAGVFHTEDGLRAFAITAEPAHAADGATVPTTIAVTDPDEITLTVHHREGNPVASGAPFVYPVDLGEGWEGGFRSTTFVIKPPDEAELRAQREAEAAAAAAAPAAAATDPQAAPEAKPQHVLVTNALGSDKLVFRPRAFLLSADGSFGLQAVRWQSYGGAVAKATARAFVNDCDPSCAAGHITHPPAKLTLSKVVDCDGKPIYVRLRYVLSGPLPQGFPRRGGYSMRPLGEDGKPDC